MNKFAIGDIHGRLEATEQVLDMSNFDFENDLLIVLGDICDGGYNTAQVIELLLKVKNIIYIIGNHDEWFINNLSKGWVTNLWLHQGGKNTVESYGGEYILGRDMWDESIPKQVMEVNVPVTHQEFFNNGKFYHEMDRMLFVHGGYSERYGVKKTSKETLLWDRNMWEDARFRKIGGDQYKKIFIGHTALRSMEPEKRHNVWNLDCGAGWDGRLCLMNIDTEEYWLSDIQEPAGR